MARNLDVYKVGPMIKKNKKHMSRKRYKRMLVWANSKDI